jgi:hypothetical protein
MLACSPRSPSGDLSTEMVGRPPWGSLCLPWEFPGHAGHPVRVSTETLTLVRLALAGARVTGGRYDPTVLGAVQRAGYDRSFELLAGGRSAGGSSTLGLGHQRVAVDLAGSSVTLPPGSASTLAGSARATRPTSSSVSCWQGERP